MDVSLRLGEIRLPRRLAAVARAVLPATRIADVGTDHGLLPVRLLLAGEVSWAVATERSEARLALAHRLAATHGVSGLALRAGDGPAPLLEEDRIDVLVLAGMGGRTIRRILEPARLTALGLRRLPPAGDRPPPTYQPSDPSSEIERVPAGRLDRPDGAAAMPVRIAVRGPDKADLKTVEGLVQESKEDTHRVGSSPQAVTKAIGQASPALQATTLTLGALLMPAALGIEIYGQRQQDAIVRTLREIDLLTLLRAELVRRAAPVGAGEPAAELTVTVRTYGLAPRSTPCPTCGRPR